MSKPFLLVFTVILIMGGYDLAAVYWLTDMPSISQFFVDMHHRAQFAINVIFLAAGHCLFPVIRYIEKPKDKL
jgi:hypothetical protein